MKNKVVLFEIPPSNLKKAKDFYESIFDWKVNLWEDEGGSDGIERLWTRTNSRLNLEASTEVSTNANQKPTIRRSVWKRVRLMGRSTPSRRPEESVTPKHSIGEWGFMADFADPEGNIIALWEKPVR